MFTRNRLTGLPRVEAISTARCAAVKGGHGPAQEHVVAFHVDGYLVVAAQFLRHFPADAVQAGFIALHGEVEKQPVAALLAR